MQESRFRELMTNRGLSQDQLDEAVDAVKGLERFAAKRGSSLETLGLTILEDYLAHLIEEGANSRLRLRALTNYLYLTGRHEAYVYMTGVFGSLVLQSWAERTRDLAGAEIHDRVFGDAAIPPLGSPQRENPPVVGRIIEGLQAALPHLSARNILTGNHHRVPEAAYHELRRICEESGIDAMLRHRHEQLLAELEEHARTGEPWYEQLITPQVVEMVRADPEIQAGVRRGDTIYVRKIPYAPQDYLNATAPVDRRYYQCHCPLARASIAGGQDVVSAELCYCSGGYEKLPFDVAFGEPVQVEVLESALAGDEGCRFAIKIPEGRLAPTIA